MEQFTPNTVLTGAYENARHTMGFELLSYALEKKY